MQMILKISREGNLNNTKPQNPRGKCFERISSFSGCFVILYLENDGHKESQLSTL